MSTRECEGEEGGGGMGGRGGRGEEVFPGEGVLRRRGGGERS